MTRPLKFRALRDGTWYTMEFVGGGLLWSSELLKILADKSPRDVKFEAFCQFTGLSDKNGKEIYEGDLLRITPDTDLLDPEVVQVYFKDGGFIVEYDFTESDLLTATPPIGWAIDHWDAGGDKYEVIGNIHENPELLK